MEPYLLHSSYSVIFSPGHRTGRAHRVFSRQWPPAIPRHTLRSKAWGRVFRRGVQTKHRALSCYTSGSLGVTNPLTDALDSWLQGAPDPPYHNRNSDLHRLISILLISPFVNDPSLPLLLFQRYHRWLSRIEYRVLPFLSRIRVPRREIRVPRRESSLRRTSTS